MPRGRKVSLESLEAKIEKAQAEVAEAKDKYEKANAELKALIQKRDNLRSENILKALESSGKSYDEIMEFLGVQDAEKEEG
jgi:outer membrane protein TolC